MAEAADVPLNVDCAYGEPFPDISFVEHSLPWSSRLIAQESRPFYAAKARFAWACCARELAGLDYRIHEAEGAIFLWLWLSGLPITAQEFYQRLKARGVLIIPGHHFAPGRQKIPAHLEQCIRLSFAQPEETVSRGIAIVAEEVRRAFAWR